MIEFRSQDIQVRVSAPDSAAASELLTADCLRLVGYLCDRFDGRRHALLAARRSLAAAYDAGETPHFISHPAASDPHWRCAPVPADIQDRRVEITGPVDRKMVINGLNSGAKVYMADFEDSTSPTFHNVVDGQLNLRDAVNETIRFVNPNTGKVYEVQPNPATLFVRPRGWHLDEAHVTVNGKVASGAIFDFAVYFFHNVHNLLAKGTAPYYYLPKLESHKEAKLWNDVFCAAQQYMGVPVGTIRATVLLETITAAFEMEEILYELKDHSIGLNCGRWDYLFSYIKKFKLHTDKLTPDRQHLTMTTPLMDAYVKRLIRICHSRGTFAMGGMSASIPIKGDAAKNQAAMQKVADDKIREVRAGHDGTWVAHPALVKVAMDAFNEHMHTPNQINKPPTGPLVTEADLLRLPNNIPPQEAITSQGLSRGVGIVLAYTEAWLRGVGCIPLHNAMEDAATAEISRAQIWQWRTQGARTADDNMLITAERIAELVQHHVGLQQQAATGGGRWRLAGNLVTHMLNKSELDDFLTSVCYPHIVTSAHDSGVVSRL